MRIVFFVHSIVSDWNNGHAHFLRGWVRALTEAGHSVLRLLLTTDFYEDANASLTYHGPGRQFPVDGNFFDPDVFEQQNLAHPGFRVLGDMDYRVDWTQTKPRMLQYHGYPYTAIGVTLPKS